MTAQFTAKPRDWIMPPKPITPLMRIARATAEETGVRLETILGAAKAKWVSDARHAMFWCARKATDASLPQIGRAYNRDHTSIAHGIRKVDDAMSPSLEIMLNRIIRRAQE